MKTCLRDSCFFDGHADARQNLKRSAADSHVLPIGQALGEGTTARAYGGALMLKSERPPLLLTRSGE